MLLATVTFIYIYNSKAIRRHYGIFNKIKINVTVFLTEANFKTVSQAILKFLIKYGNDYDNAYMNKS